jgi:hypothetical protein
MPAPGAVPTFEPRPEPGRRRRGARAAIATLVLAGAAVGGWALFATAGDSFRATAGEPAPPPAAPPNRTPTATPPASAVHTDTLAWTIQIAAYGTAAKALAHADRLATENEVAALVSPVQQSGAGTVWYRVLAGSYATREAAAAARQALWRHGTAARGIGDLLRAPYSLAPATDTSVAALRRRGLPAIRWRNRILIGAFETPEQAAFTEAQLTRAGVRATLLPRVGTAP